MAWPNPMSSITSNRLEAAVIQDGHLYACGPIREMSIEHSYDGPPEMNLSFYPDHRPVQIQSTQIAAAGGAPVGQYPGIIEIRDRQGGRITVIPTGKNSVALNTAAPAGGEAPEVALNKKMAEALIKAINDATAYSGHAD